MMDEYAFPGIIIGFLLAFLIMIYGASVGDEFLVGAGTGGMVISGAAVAAWWM